MWYNDGMSKKDYELIAGILKRMRDPLLEYDLSTLDWVARTLEGVLSAGNPDFNPEKWRIATGRRRMIYEEI